ncbi:MBL fold metallo-hydrolase [Tsuneonella sp. HG222]
MALDNVRHWQVGDVRITRIVEIASFADDISVLLRDAGPEIFEPYHSWLRPHFVTDDGKMLIQWQAFAVQTPSRTVMIDTCIGNDRQRHFAVFNDLQTAFLDDLVASGITPDEVDTVCCTHMHYDHVGWNTRRVGGQWVPTFPNARYLFDRVEFAELRSLQEVGDWHAMHAPDSIEPIIAAGLHEFIDAPGYQVCEEIHLEHTPGHTAGHCSVYIQSGGERAVITGDILHHPVQIAVPHHVGNFDQDPATAVATRQAFVSRHSSGPTLVIGSHFAGPTAGWIVPDGTTQRFETFEPSD